MRADLDAPAAERLDLDLLVVRAVRHVPPIEQLRDAFVVRCSRRVRRTVAASSDEGDVPARVTASSFRANAAHDHARSLVWPNRTAAKISSRSRNLVALILDARRFSSFPLASSLWSLQRAGHKTADASSRRSLQVGSRTGAAHSMRQTRTELGGFPTTYQSGVFQHPIPAAECGVRWCQCWWVWCKAQG